MPKLVAPELGLDEAPAANDPLIADDGVDKVALAGGDGARGGIRR